MVVLFAAVVSLGLAGCKDKSEHPNGDHPTKDDATKEHPAKEAPANEHPE